MCTTVIQIPIYFQPLTSRNFTEMGRMTFQSSSVSYSIHPAESQTKSIRKKSRIPLPFIKNNTLFKN